MLYAIKTMLYASDLSPRARMVFRHAAGMAQKFDARLHAITVTRPGFMLSHHEHGSDDGDIPSGDNAAEELLKRRIAVFEQAHPEYELHRYLESVRGLEGDPAKVILEVARQIQADVIVMGSRGHSALDEILLGSVAHKVTIKTTVPVILVPFDREGS
jgi:nucleotide-binding universal stress UspA family protein